MIRTGSISLRKYMCRSQSARRVSLVTPNEQPTLHTPKKPLSGYELPRVMGSPRQVSDKEGDPPPTTQRAKAKVGGPGRGPLRLCT